MHRKKRTAFTLVELLVVIAIITILAGLLLSAIMKLRHVGQKVQARSEVTELHKAIVAFKMEMKPVFLPSRLKLAFKSTSLTDTDGKATVAFMCSMFPYVADTWQNTGITWGYYKAPGPDGVLGTSDDVDTAFPGAADGTVTLEGDQCLVFLLAGVVQNGICKGWSTNPANPADTTGSERKKFFDFQQVRLKYRTNQKFFSYYDPFGTPYAYFSTNTAANNYNTTTISGASMAGDCPSLGVQAYGTTGNYFMPTTNQIICAGPDKKFGNKWATWTVETAATAYPWKNAGFDDIANFHNYSLGVRGQ